MTLAFVNAHAMNCVAGSSQFVHALESTDWLVRDGSGMAILLKTLKRDPGLNLNGTDLIPRIIQRFSGKKIALLGTCEPYLAQAAEKISTELALGSQIITMDGFRYPQEYLNFCMLQQPELIVLGMGMPKQEGVAAMLREQLRTPCLIVCGGAIIDFLGGKVTRAPSWVRSLGVEWAYRLAKEPRRLFARYVLGNPIFIYRTMRFKGR
ncbi:MAG TPA: WecB/TagA/CpsF family glycosyltransferase [Rhodocyclaceae bacterium]|nr:WecB/TagA/CpsF family glycosyltransferase [Rhodocyclaceae bacterium]